jgi:hypothetical protein
MDASVVGTLDRIDRVTQFTNVTIHAHLSVRQARPRITPGMPSRRPNAPA